MPLHHSMTGSMLNQTMLKANNNEHYFYEKRVLKNELACFKDIFIVFSTKFWKMNCRVLFCIVRMLLYLFICAYIGIVYAVFFLSLFWVSKWHPKILQWHPKFWKSKYGFTLHWSKTIWGKHVFLRVAIATDGCNVVGRHNFLTQKLEAKIVGMVSVHCHAYRLASAC